MGLRPKTLLASSIFYKHRLQMQIWSIVFFVEHCKLSFWYNIKDQH